MTTENPLSDAELISVIEKSARQYEESIRIADLTDLTDFQAGIEPTYNWDTPIGIVITGGKHAGLV